MDNEYNGSEPENGQEETPQEEIFRAETEVETSNQGANMQTSTFEANNQTANTNTETVQGIGHRYQEEEKLPANGTDTEQLKKILCSVGIGLVALFMLLVFLQTVLMSMTNYSPLKGLLGSGWVGFDNFTKILQMPQFVDLISNSLLIGLVGMAVGAVYVFLASLSITNIKNAFGKAVVLAVYILPTIFPATLYANLIPFVLRNEPAVMRILVAILDGLRLSGFVIVAAFFAKGHSVAESAKCMLLFIAVKLIMFFTFENGLILTSYMPATYETLDVFGTYSYRIGFVNCKYSVASAAYIIKTLLQIIPAVLGCVVIALIAKSKKTVSGAPIQTENKTYSGALVALGAMVIPVVLFFAILISGSGILPQNEGFDYSELCSNGLYIAIVSALIVSVISFGIATLASNSGILGIICVTLGAMLGNDLMTTYIFCHDTHALNTYNAVFIMNTYMIPLIALLMTYVFKNGKDLLRNLGVFLVFFALLVGWFWGDAYMPSIALMEEKRIPISVLMRKLFVNSYVTEYDGAVNLVSSHNVPVSMFVIMFGVIVVVGFCLLAAFIINRKEKEI